MWYTPWSTQSFFWTFFFHTQSTWWLDGLWGLWHWVYHISLIYLPQSIDFPSFCATSCYPWGRTLESDFGRMTSVDKGLGWSFAACFFRLFVGTSWSPIFWTVDRHTEEGWVVEMEIPTQNAAVQLSSFLELWLRMYREGEEFMKSGRCYRCCVCGKTCLG